MESLDTAQLQRLLPSLKQLAQSAGAAILAIYHRDQPLAVTGKADDSPLTEADLAAHGLLLAGLTDLLPNTPVLSEESPLPGYAERRQWPRYWLIDPLDGTKEFINRNGEFTVNIALVADGEPVLGLVYVPVLGLLYWGGRGLGAHREQGGKAQAIHTRSVASRAGADLALELVASRRHGSDEVDRLMARIQAATGLRLATKNMGSSLKLCLVAEGQADLYPRLAPTCEWDTAAAQAVVEAAGGQVLDTGFQPLRYNRKADILNPYFYVIGDPAFNWPALLAD